MRVIHRIRSVANRVGVRKLRMLWRRTMTRHYLSKKYKEKNSEDVMRVAFIVYEPAMWDKQEPVYQELLTRPHVEAFLIIVPDTSLQDQNASAPKRLFFQEKYSNAIVYSDEVYDQFERGEFHYTFYQTPYCFKYPKSLQPYKLVAHTKICYIPYGYVGSSDFVETTSKADFFENVYFGFMDNEIMQGVLLKKFSKTSKKGWQHFLSLGYPSFEYAINMAPPKDGIERILWIPRWSYAEKGGGSHFLEYKDQYNLLASQNPEFQWVMRPHPLMFPSMAKLGLMTEQSIEKYRKELKAAGVVIDENSLLNDALCQTDILLADYSSIIIMYFLSGRPIIYCNCDIEMNGVFAELREVMYIAEKWDDVLKHIENLKKGIDPLKEKRLGIVARECAKHSGSAKRIADRIVADFEHKI